MVLSPALCRLAELSLQTFGRIATGNGGREVGDVAERRKSACAKLRTLANRRSRLAERKQAFSATRKQSPRRWRARTPRHACVTRFLARVSGSASDLPALDFYPLAFSVPYSTRHVNGNGSTSSRPPVCNTAPGKVARYFSQRRRSAPARIFWAIGSEAVGLRHLMLGLCCRSVSNRTRAPSHETWSACHKHFRTSARVQLPGLTT